MKLFLAHQKDLENRSEQVNIQYQKKVVSVEELFPGIIPRHNLGLFSLRSFFSLLSVYLYIQLNEGKIIIRERKILDHNMTNYLVTSFPSDLALIISEKHK